MNRPVIFAGLRVVGFFSTRHGGVSKGAYESLNLGLSTGDDDRSVRANRDRLFRSAGLHPERVAIAGQVHAADVRFVDAPGLYSGCDALVTDAKDLALAMTAADCAVVLLADPKAAVVGAAHAGWRGTVGGIVAATVKEMVGCGAAKERLLVYVTPCISTQRFEVGEEVARQFDEEFVVRREEWPRPHVDLRAAIAAQLVHAGVMPGHIELSAECTFDNPDYFSYRAEAGQTGRMLGVIALRSP